MKSNVGGIDKGLRIVIGAALIAVAVFTKGNWWGYIGVIPFFTGIFGFCPLYSLIGVNTCGCNKDK